MLRRRPKKRFYRTSHQSADDSSSSSASESEDDKSSSSASKIENYRSSHQSDDGSSSSSASESDDDSSSSIPGEEEEEEFTLFPNKEELDMTTRMLQHLSGENLQKVQEFIKSLDSSTNNTTIVSTRPQHKKTSSIPKTTLQFITPATLLSEGLSHVGFNHSRQSRASKDLNIRRFVSFFGAPPAALSPLFKDIRDMFTEESPTCRDLLLTCNWLKGYDVMHVLEGRWGNCEDYMQPRIFRCQEMLQRLRRKKMKLPNSHTVIAANVDTVSFTVQEFRKDPSAKYYDQKSHSAGVVSIFFFNLICDYNLLLNLTSNVSFMF
jgi:hypothetical protein